MTALADVCTPGPVLDAIRDEVRELEAKIARLHQVEELWLAHVRDEPVARPLLVAELLGPDLRDFTAAAARTSAAAALVCEQDVDPPPAPVANGAGPAEGKPAPAPETKPAPPAEPRPAPAPETKPAPRPETKPAPRPTPVDAAADGGPISEGRARRAAVLAYLQSRAGEWLPPGDVARAVNETPASLKRVWLSLLDSGAIEAQGATAGRRYRVPRSDAGASSEAPKPEPAATAPTLSGRERRQQRHEQADRERREQLARSPIVAGADADGTIDGKVLEALMAVPATIPELATRMRLERADVAAAIRRLKDAGDVDHAGRRAGGGEIIYRGQP